MNIEINITLKIAKKVCKICTHCCIFLF